MSSTSATRQNNFSHLVLRHAVADSPLRNAPALVLPRAWNAETVTQSDALTFGAIAARVAQLQAGIRAAGMKPGQRVVVMFPVSPDLYALVFALFAEGLSVVLIDTGMGLKKVLQSIRDARAQAIVSMHALLRFHLLLPPLWRLEKYSVDSSGLFVRPFASLVAPPPATAPEVRERRGADHALITFTSGSTGRPKGADRTHALLAAQHHALEHEYPMRRSDVHMTCFPVVAMHDMACGVPTVLPAVDLKSPGSVEPAAVIRQIREHGVTLLTGAPAFLGRIARFVLEHDLELPTLRRIGVGGAPVSRQLCREVLAAFPAADCQVVYGSTEAEPITSVPMADVANSNGDGFLVGAPASAASVAIVSLPDPAPPLDERGIDPYRVAPGETGEVVVSGPHVNRGYLDNPKANAENKLFNAAGALWHRTGDVGYEDGQGRLWLVGRVKDVIQRADRNLHPLPVEAAIDSVFGVQRSALVAHRRAPEGELAVQTAPDVSAAAFDNDVMPHLRAVLTQRGIGNVPIRRIDAVAVDGRHNSKIDRPTLRRRLEAR